MDEKDIQTDIRDVIYGYGAEHLLECMYAYEKALYFNAKGIASVDRTEQNIKTMEYYGKIKDALHTAWVEVADIGTDYPFNI